MTQLSFIINIALAWEFAKRYHTTTMDREKFIIFQSMRMADTLTPQAMNIAKTLIGASGQTNPGPVNIGVSLVEFYFDTYLALAVDGVNKLPPDATPIDINWYEELISKSTLPKGVNVRA